MYHLIAAAISIVSALGAAGLFFDKGKKSPEKDE
jgi:hypothetical protein